MEIEKMKVICQILIILILLFCDIEMKKKGEENEGKRKGNCYKMNNQFINLKLILSLGPLATQLMMTWIVYWYTECVEVVAT